MSVGLSPSPNGVAQPPAPPPEATIPRTPTPAQPPTRDTSPPPAPPYGSGQRSGGLVGGLILISLGLAFLLGNISDLGGALLFVGLGAAFVVARIATSRYGYAVPAGILLGFGTFVGLSESGFLVGPAAGAGFFILLGLGFLAVYVIGARPYATWPIVVAFPLLVFGLALGGSLTVQPLRDWVWLAAYWPVGLVILGAWLLVRSQVPENLHGPVGALGALIAVTFLALAAVASLQTMGAAGLRQTDFGGRSVLLPSFSLMPYTETETLSAPLAAGQPLRIDNGAGRTTLQVGTTDQVLVTAVKHGWSVGRTANVSLQPQGTAWNLRSESASGGYADLSVTVPASASVQVVAGSGDVEADGLSGSLQIQTGSGDIRLRQVSGTANVNGGSGSVLLQDVPAALQVTTGSGAIRGENLSNLQSSTSGSGSQDLAGVFAGAATIRSGSGSVRVQLDPGSSVRVDARSLSGSVRERGQPLIDQNATSRSLTGRTGAGSATLSIQTASGSITVEER